ncbi:hypothetical protein COCC4DRAFT_191373 [Bipolaris maydis ATCC 48331]|uniref:DNA 3'-5' helicase n=1 Tax=Cochliobolus heterostrophus (strain C4 / ATCC 48331 / race T) TaxID=665024 RepID=N4XP91_COCH4|nr:uncharacterized protein COCC4DRAFT_191373 [Bipolaris maydis ATCC 48331]ENI06937.1 hypothetical protein COCC4DRAFT_191373 [Bipolaris maydis ATCC 48331]KAJ5027920.1 nucleotide-sugar transporter-domain-containing protein [Bipolaris maydis]KAJ6266442.1 nucleotide-sugar transporter-domain-containing protein [Bipolaris maydis]
MVVRTASGTLGGVSMKHLSLVTLTVQNSALILIMHYSRIMPLAGGQRYHTSTSVFLNEVIKLTISLTMAMYEMSKSLPSNTTIATLSRTLTTAIFTNESWKLAVPAVIYTIQNNLQYLAVSNLDAATFQVTYQLKILTTAIFSVLLLGRTLSARKWLSLLLLIVGVSIIQVPQALSQPDVPATGSTPWTKTLEQLHSLGHNVAARMAKRSGSYEGIHEDRASQVPHMNRRVGLFAVLISCALSGLAGVLFEKILKDSTSGKTTTLWVRNCQLSFWSLFPSLFLGVIWKDGEVIAKTGFFVGYNWVVWTAIGFQAAGGVIVALVINYADNIAKNFATSISILLSCIASVYFFDFKVTQSFFLGTCIVLFATYLYTKPERGMQQSAVKIADFQKTTVERPYEERGMGERFYHQEQPGSSRRVSRYNILQPQIKQPARLTTPRDRYRVTRYDDPMYDTVEDDYANGVGSQLDSFVLDERLLQQSYSDRQPQATHDNERLSFAPALSQPSYGWFAYNSAQFQDSSHDPQIDQSSSPAFKASQRRLKHASASTAKYGSGTQTSRDTRRHTIELKAHGYQRHHGQIIPGELQESLVTALHAPPMCQGIRLVPVATLPDRLRTIFPYPTFNAVQSKCFDTVFRSDNNFVLASPTGSGKTVILELAICRAFATNSTGQYKIVYQAPTKALCSERQRDWETKFNKIGLKCAELTGDSDISDLRHVQSANIIITTPEKWDSMTRKWRDHEKLMRLIRVFLIDEVHILKEDRGATLEAVVSRMKSIGTNVRFVALSATVPNFDDIATWLGKSPTDPNTPATNESFGEEFRPVKLRKHVCGYMSNANNEFGFEKVLDNKINDVIATYSEGKPIMVFCATRNSTLNTAKLIASWWSSRMDNDRFWTAPSKSIRLLNKDLRDTIASGVAFHHAGLDIEDRVQVEKSFIAGEISVICCTSTLAVGVNLPCHLVVIKNTMAWGPAGHQEYSDLEMMQMLGRAGRPQFDDTAVAVIMTRQIKARRYEQMVTGQEIIESKLHLNLIDHMNAEIGLGTIYDLPSARRWLKGTFLFVRLQQNPTHYKLEGSRNGQSIEEQVDDICFRDVNLLQQSNLVSSEERFTCTEFGHAMSRYYVHFETMKLFMGFEAKSSPSEILSAIAQAKEYSNIRFRQGEKTFYKVLNKSPSIRWTIPVNLDLPAQKISLMIQSVLGSADISWDGDMAKHRSQYATETMMVFRNLGSLIRCIVDCQIVLGDAVSIHSALMLERSFGAKAWDDSPLQMKQIETLGVVAVRKLVNAGIKSIEDLEGCDPHRIEAVVGRNPPYGLQILEKIKCFPKLRVSLQEQHSTIVKILEGVKMQIKVDIGFMNERPPLRFNNKLIYVCLLVETSDGRKIHFARISGSKLGTGQSLSVPVLLTSSDQSINCHVMCDGIGVMRTATMRPQISPSMYPIPKPSGLDSSAPHQSNMSKRRTEDAKESWKASTTRDDFGDDELDDDTLVKAACGDLEFDDIDAYPDPLAEKVERNTPKANSNNNRDVGKIPSLKGLPEAVAKGTAQDPVQLANGKWACNHPCKDREACKHLCCKNGMDKPPKKKPVAKLPQLGEPRMESQQKLPTPKIKTTQTLLQLAAPKRKASIEIEELDLTQQEKRNKVDRALDDLEAKGEIQKGMKGSNLSSASHSILHMKPAYCYHQGDSGKASSSEPLIIEPLLDSSDYGNIQFDDPIDFLDPPQQDSVLSDCNTQTEYNDFADCEAITLGISPESETFDDDDSLLGDVLVGLADSHSLQGNNEGEFDSKKAVEGFLDCANKESSEKVRHLKDDGIADVNEITNNVLPRIAYTGGHCQPHESPAERQRSQSDRLINSSRINGVFPDAMANIMDDSKTKKPDARKNNLTLAQLKKYQQPSTTKELPEHLAKAVGETACSLLPEEKIVPDAYKDLEPWLLEEFGDIVELVD